MLSTNRAGTSQMAGEASKNNVMPGWLADGLDHVWLPYSQMKTVTRPLPVVRTFGARIVLADGRELIDGIASWWTACHGYNHPHIRQAVETQLAQMPHVMFGGLVHEQPLQLAQRLTALLPGDLTRVFFSEFRFGCGRGRAQNGGRVLDQSRPAVANPFCEFPGWVPWRYRVGDGGVRPRNWDAW